MVLNLLDNAARHTPAGSHIELRLRTEGGDAVLEVADDGPGIPAELRDQVFDRFVRGPGRAGRCWPSSRRRPGTTASAGHPSGGASSGPPPTGGEV